MLTFKQMALIAQEKFHALALIWGKKQLGLFTVGRNRLAAKLTPSDP
jgi:hypothetical protein